MSEEPPREHDPAPAPPASGAGVPEWRAAFDELVERYQSVRSRELNLRRFVEGTDLLLTLVDGQGRFLYLNPVAERVFGLPRTDCLGHSAFEFVHPEDRETTRLAFEGWVRNGDAQPIHWENRQIGKDGNVRRFAWTIQAQHVDGELIGFASWARDVTETREAEAARAESETMHQAVLASVLDPTITIDARGFILTVSGSVKRVFDYEPEDLVGENISVLMPEPHHSQHDEYLQNYSKTGLSFVLGRTREFLVARRDGSQIECELSADRVDIPGRDEPLFVGSFRDVSDRRRAERALRESERLFHAVFDQEYQYVALMQPDGSVLEANRTMLEATGLSRADAVGRKFWYVPWWKTSKETRDRVSEAVGAAAGGACERFELEYTDRAGQTGVLDFSVKPVSEEGESVDLLIAEGRDITELKRAQRAETSMLRALAEVGESAAILAHEIKNPITGVHMALRAVARELGEDQRAVLEDLVARMQRLERMMRGTLSFAKPLQVTTAACELRPLLEGVRNALRGEIEAAQAIVEVDLPSEPPRFLGDAHLMDEMISNLLRNALEALPPGGQVVLGATRSGKRDVRLSVEDDGPGIDPEVADTLFKPYVTTKHRGTGLGLPICRKIVEEQGGRIELEPGRLGGACFAVYLPECP